MQHLMKRTIANEQTYGEERQLQERREEERLLRQAIQESTREYQTQARLNSGTTNNRQTVKPLYKKLLLCYL